MRNYFTDTRISPRLDVSAHRWHRRFEESQFICCMEDGWYVESLDGEFGPFDNLLDAENFCEHRKH